MSDYSFTERAWDEARSIRNENIRAAALLPFRCVVDESAGLAEASKPASGSLAPSQADDGMGSVLASASPDPKPPARTVNPAAEPYDSTPVDENTCPFCGRYTTLWQKHHVVGRGQSGDDVSENLVWVCAGCHRRLHDADRRTGALLYAYCNLIPVYREYATDKKWPGWLAYRYLGEDIWL